MHDEFLCVINDNRLYLAEPVSGSPLLVVIEIKSLSSNESFQKLATAIIPSNLAFFLSKNNAPPNHSFVSVNSSFDKTTLESLTVSVVLSHALG